MIRVYDSFFIKEYKVDGFKYTIDIIINFNIYYLSHIDNIYRKQCQYEYKIHVIDEEDMEIIFYGVFDKGLQMLEGIDIGDNNEFSTKNYIDIVPDFNYFYHNIDLGKVIYELVDIMPYKDFKKIKEYSYQIIDILFKEGKYKRIKDYFEEGKYKMTENRLLGFDDNKTVFELFEPIFKKSR